MVRQYRFVFLLGGRLALEAGVTGVSVSIRELYDTLKFVRQKDRWILQQGLTHRLSGTVLLLRNSSRSEVTVAAQAHPGLAYSWSFISLPHSGC